MSMKVTVNTRFLPAHTSTILRLNTAHRLIEHWQFIFSLVISADFNILLAVHPNIIIVFFANLMQKFFVFSIYIYYISQHVSDTIMLILRRSKCISTASGIVTLFRWLFNTHVNLYTEQSPKQSDDTRCCINKIWPPEDENNSARNM